MRRVPVVFEGELLSEQIPESKQMERRISLYPFFEHGDLILQMGDLSFVLVNLEPILTHTLEGSLYASINSIKLPFLGIQIPQKGLFVGFHLA